MTVTNWTKEKIQEISSKSSGGGFPSILKEWFIIDRINLNPLYNSVCGLCGRPNLYYEYFISNRLNDNKILIGSVCISLFFEEVDKIAVEANGNILNLDKREMKQHLNKLFIKRIILDVDSKINKTNLNDWEKNTFYPDVKEKVIKQEKLSPKQGNIFIKIVSKIVNEDEVILKKIGKIIKINLARSAYKEQLNSRDQYNWRFLKYALTKEQIKKF